MKIVVTIPQGEVMDTFLSADTRKRLESLGTVIYNESTAQYTPDQVRELLRDAQVVVTGWGTPKLTGELLADNDSLRLIVHTGGSVADLVDEGTYAKGIRVLCGNDMFAESGAEGTIGYMLSALRRIPDDVFTLRNGGWKNGVVTRGLLGKQIGILGVGAIARHLMRMLQPFHWSIPNILQASTQSRCLWRRCSQAAASSVCTHPSLPSHAVCSADANLK